MHRKVPIRAGRVRRALARAMTVTALATATSLVMSVAHAVPQQVAPKAADPAPGHAVNGELAHYDFEWSEPDYTPNTIEGGPRAAHHNGVFAGARTDNEAIWGNLGSGGRTLRLDGVDDYLSVPVTLPTDQSFTVSAWVQLGKAPGQSYSVITQPGSRVSGFYLKVNPDGKPVFGMPRADSETTGWDAANGTAVVAGANDWTHLTGVYDSAAAQIRLYVNGALASTAAHTATWQAAGEVQVGRGLRAGTPGDYFPGRMDEVRLWQRALPDIEASAVAIPDAQMRSDRCVTGNWLHAGGPKVKAVAAQSLAAGRAVDTRQAVFTWGMGTLGNARMDDQNDQRAANQAQTARQDVWAKVTTPYAVHTSDYMTFLHAPEYGKAMRDFLLDSGEKNFDGPPPPKPTQAALDRAIAILKERRAATADQPWGGIYGFYASEDWLKSLSSYQIARWIRLGGFPSAAPAKDSVEFRMEVEDLKIQWAGCDTTEPLDPLHLFDEVVATANAEWQAEQAAQAKQRADIAAADIQANKDVRTASNAMVEAQGQAYIVSRMLVFQKYWQGRPKTDSDYPKPAQFTQATTEMANAKKAISAQLAVAQKAAASAKTQADRASAAQTEAGKIAAANGTPYGRGLTYALQSAQVTKAEAAAAQSAAKAVEATLNAVSATQADSKALYSLGDTQSHAAKAEFQRAAAQEAADQAHAAAAAAATQADRAAQAAARAKADKEKAQQAEQTAKAAAADAHEKRAVADQERANAADARARADAERTKAAQAEATAQSQRASAATALSAAQTAGQTAADKAAAAEAAESRASVARDAALAAEANRNSTAARQKALEAAAAAAEGTADAQETRQAANDAKTAAGQATSAASGARSAANDASAAAVAARTAATQAEGAASRARAASEAAQADAAITAAAAATSHAAAADAIAASEQAAQNVKNANEQVQKAGAAAAQARVAAAASRKEADQAAVDSARTAGQAFAAAQAAAAARDAASSAIRAGNDAIALGTPFRETDSSAALAVLVGQSGKTLAQQQADVAKARADEAAKAAKDAAALAAKADADAKAAAQASANAAADAASAAKSLQRARESAAQAASDAEATKLADANTGKYDMQAQTDAFYASISARDATTDATAARSSATAAEQDAASARRAASAAESDAATARSTATRADQDAVAAEKAAANARSDAEQADQAATRTEEKERADELAARQAAMASDGSSPGPELTADEEKILLAQCGQSCVDAYRKARAEASQDVLDWVKENGGQILLDVLGVTDAKKCFADGDVEGCLWTLVNVGSLIVVIGKLPAVSKAIVRISGGIAKFFEETEAAKRVLDRARKLIERARKAPGCPVKAVTKAASAKSAHTAVAPRAATCGFIAGEIPDAAAIDRGSLVKIKEKQLEKALASLGEDPHGFKEDWVGKAVSRFDAVRDGAGRIILMSKDGKILVPTNYRYIP
ncbi:concanavalin A-like lectin/glucanase superfamily protein [Kitasatospora atroaurantiaca]|uniref:Concanavalin A-like lectin/glucanase superfamily protein n=2 Tax=Kitasatospora atroaurantiaca TaxID=285545 RepID=A0A561EV03_9ACTN|nr:concanavalin A-like lectin/glucanase superfamily protein [Kitasatospora atroaurantiaca]